MIYTLEEIRLTAEIAETSIPKVNRVLSALSKAIIIANRTMPKYAPANIHVFFDDFCNVVEATPKELQTRKRNRDVSYVKHAFVAIACELFPKENHDYIGSFVGQDHTMVHFYCKEIYRVEQKRRVYKQIKRELGL